MNLYSDTDLAGQFGIEVGKFHDLRRKHNWPHVRIDRFTFRFTEQQAQQIVAAMTVAPAKKSTGKGLTSRSEKRAS